MRRTTLSLALMGLLGLAGQAAAKVCTIDPVPAATLLLPYFEVNLTQPDGITTLFTISNAKRQAIVAHAVVWSDLAVPVLNFDVYLTGYDVQSIDLRGILMDGKFPATASAGQDPNDTISPQGPFSDDVDLAGCRTRLPMDPLDSRLRDDVQRALTGKLATILFGGGFASLDHGDDVARGYVTVDVVGTCTTSTPVGLGYFGAGGAGEATDFNDLLGDYFYLDPSKSQIQSFPMVHVEASASDPETSTPGQYTFYGRYENWNATDNREPLPTRFFVRYLNSAFAKTDLIVWRDPKSAPSVSADGKPPSWYPLNRESLFAFDEEEHAVEIDGSSPVPLPFAAAAGRERVGGKNLPIPYSAGWLYLNLNTFVVGNPSPPEDPDASQAWVAAVMTDSSGRLTMGLGAYQLDSACTVVHTDDPHR